MELITCKLKLPSLYPLNLSYQFNINLSFHNYPLHFNYLDKSKPCSVTITHANKKKNSELKPTIIDQALDDDDNDVSDFDEFGDDELLVGEDEELLDDGEYFEDEYDGENADVFAGDGAEGGGISLAGTSWDKEALAIAENVIETFAGDLGIYAFRTLANATIQLRIEKLSTKSGSPSMSDIEAFSAAYRAQLDEAELAKTIPENISLEVSSPGVERVVRIPQELDRFKERPMYVKYLSEVVAGDSSTESEGVFSLVSFDLETNSCTWGLADVRINREKAGKGRPMSKKQREWRVTTPFDSIRLVRLYSDF